MLGAAMRFLRILGRVLLAIVALVAALFLSTRFIDGPMGPIPGGPLKSGSLVDEAVVDWSFATAVETIELELLADERSRTVWILVDRGRAFIPCAIGAPPGKRWHLSAEADGRSMIRIEGKRYPVTLTRVTDPPLFGALVSVVEDKYPPPPGAADAESWFFSIASR
jgi:hypothetical protein